MTPAQFKQARHSLSLSQSEMAIALGLKTARAIRHYESGDRVVSGPIEKLVGVLVNQQAFDNIKAVAGKPMPRKEAKEQRISFISGNIGMDKPRLKNLLNEDSILD